MSLSRRTVQTILSTFSLALCAFFVFLWYRSHRLSDWITYAPGSGVYHEYVTLPGQFRYTRVTGYPAAQQLEWKRDPFPPLRPVFGQQPVYRTWTFVGIGFEHGSRRINAPDAPAGVYSPITVSYQITAVPFAVPALVMAIFGLLPWIRRRKHLRQRDARLQRGLCPACGYDLRESQHRCPECGADIHSQTQNGRTEVRPPLNRN